MNHVTPPPGWTAEEARTRFDELVRCAQKEGPQRVALPDGASVLVTASESVPSYPPPEAAGLPLIPFLQSLYVEGIDLERDYAEGEEPDLGS